MKNMNDSEKNETGTHELCTIYSRLTLHERLSSQSWLVMLIQLIVNALCNTLYIIARTHTHSHTCLYTYKAPVTIGKWYMSQKSLESTNTGRYGDCYRLVLKRREVWLFSSRVSIDMNSHLGGVSDLHLNPIRLEQGCNVAVFELLYNYHYRSCHCDKYPLKLLLVVAIKTHQEDVYVIDDYQNTL